jgi:WD40 repeat protein
VFAGKHIRTLAQAPGGTLADGYRFIKLFNEGREALLAGAGFLVRWDLENDKSLWPVKRGQPKSCAVTNDGGRIVSQYCSLDFFAQDSRGETLHTLWRPRSDDPDTAHRVCAIAIEASNGSRAISGGVAGDLVIWDFEKGTRCAWLRCSSRHEPIICIALASDANLALTGSENDVLQLWNLAEGRVVRTLSEGPKPPEIGKEAGD